LQVQSLQDDRIGSPLMSWSLLGGCHLLKMLSLNKYRINERVGRSGIHKGFKIISGRVSDVRERVSESGFEQSGCVKSDDFAQGSLTQSSGRAKFRGLLSLFSNPCRKTWICPVQTWMLGLWWKPSWISDSPWDVSCGATKEAKLIVKTR